MKNPFKSILLFSFLALIAPGATHASGLDMRVVTVVKRTSLPAIPLLETAEKRRLERIANRLEYAAASSTVDRFYSIINSERIKAGLSGYVRNLQLETSAQAYAEHLEATECFSHDDCGSRLRDRIRAYGYMDGPYTHIRTGENLAYGQEYDAEAVEDWMESPPHKDAILSTLYTDIGLGKSGQYRVIHFGMRE